MRTENTKQDEKLSENQKNREHQLNTLTGLSDRFGDSLTSAFAKNIAEARSLMMC